MAADDGQPARSLTQRLFDEPHAFEFTQAVRLLELLQPHAQPLGTGLDPGQEALALSGNLSPAFPASALGPLRHGLPRSLAFAPQAGEELSARSVHAGLPQLQVNAFALGGPNGPLPGAWQEWLQDRLRRKDRSAAAFLDIFQHRLLALLYRAQRKYRSAEPLPATAQRSADVVLRALTGNASLNARAWGNRAAQEAAALPEPHDLRAVLARAGLFANRRRSLAGFDVMVLHHFRVHVRSTPFAGGWRTLPPASRTAIGSGGRNRRLGQDAVAGTRIWDEHQGIRVRLGPLRREQYEAFLPGAPAHEALHSLAAEWFGAELKVHLELQLAAGELPRARLSRHAPLRLGWTAWAGAAESAPARLTCLAPDDIQGRSAP
ncbi:type VI secretion system baseplate subunit TssG [Paraburkholderia sp. CNPSo 3274]|uniref:type VI secretion system baseplate subunit TssG n=1 Tax=Paraburkholderia sp. CNPSo 3274 TaxID=2940932 RepID=UPI0020B7B26D|nr:type VI secretion system baseplate subunit TssG [Paraburkholderia sp. CNPSo 3274]MCP3707698.1 type VI secretion system baseplate subunit TssG [Paraburkholderia sp. CNPSo 3274]